MISQLFYYGITFFMAFAADKVEYGGFSIKAGYQAQLLTLFTLGSIAVTSTAETVIPKYYSSKVILLFLFFSVTLYSMALSVNNSGSGLPYIPNVMLALLWNIGNTFLTSALGLLTDPRLSSLSTSEKIAFGVIIVCVLIAGLASYYLKKTLPTKG